MGNERKFSREHPPLTGKRQVAAFHIGERDISPPADLADMLIKAGAQRALTTGRPFGRLADINWRATSVIQRINSAVWRADTFLQRGNRTRLKFFDNLSPNPAVKVKIEEVWIVACHHANIAA